MEGAFLPQLECLERREVPAVSGISFARGALSVRLDYRGGELELLGASATADNNFRLRFNGAPVGNASGYNITAGITVTGGDGGDIITIEPQAAGRSWRIPGNLTINSGNNADIINIQNSVRGAGFVSGTVSLNTGNGNDQVFLANTNATDSLAVGRLFSLNGGNGADSITSSKGTLNLRGFASVLSVNTVNLSPDAGGGITVAGLQITNPLQQAFNNSLTIDGTAAAVTITGNLGYSSNEREDTVSIDGLAITGDVNLGLGNGDNTVAFSANAPVAIAGSLVVNAGNNDDELTLSDANATTIDTSLRLSLGNGTNTVTIDNATIEGDASFKGGNGNDIINIATIVDVEILGSIWAALGNDAGVVADRNELQLGSNGVASATVGRALTYFGGSGTDSVALEENSSVAQLMNISLGSGQDEVSLAAGSSVGALKVNFGVDTDPDTFNNLSDADFNIVLVNYVP